MGRVVRGVGRPAISPGVWKRARRWALDLGVDASRLAELGLRLVLAMLEHPGDAEDCLVRVFKHDRELAEQVDELLAAAKPAGVRG